MQSLQNHARPLGQMMFAKYLVVMEDETLFGGTG